MPEYLYGGIALKLLVPVDDHPGISRFVNETITISIKDKIFVGILKSVNTKKKKNKDKEIEIWKEIIINVENISSVEISDLMLPDIGGEIIEEVTIMYEEHSGDLDPENIEKKFDHS